MAVVLVTHSSDMMRAADWIVVIGAGGIVVEEGTFESLVSGKGEFARSLYRGEYRGHCDSPKGRT
jgi:ABC-type multidrug transport system fused ATPase/permease subunit